MNKLAIALLSGGASSERRVSQESGNQVLNALDKDKYRIMPYDPLTDLGKLVADAPIIDAALIILHGPMGEDGTIQGILDLLDIPYQGSGVLGSALAMNKLVSKQLYEKAGLPVPRYHALSRGDAVLTDQYVDSLGIPLVVKPVVGGSSIGMSLVKSKEELAPAIEKAFEQDRSVLIERYIQGTELTCSVMGNDQLETFPVVEIIPEKGHDFFDYEAKYNAGACREICPANIDEAVSEAVKSIAKIAHTALHCRGYSRTDFILSSATSSHPELFVIETNTIPGMTQTSLLPQSAAAVGIDFSSLLDKLIYLGLEEHTKKSQIRDQQRLERILQAMPHLLQ